MEQNKPDRPHEKAPVKQITHDVLHDLVHFDAKLFRTLPTLLFKPGKLTQASLKGDDSNYVKPFALFVFLNFIFFILKSPGLFNYKLESYQHQFSHHIVEEAKKLNITVSQLSERFNIAMHFEQKEYMVVMVPLFALALHALYLTRRWHYTRHLIFALHFYTYFVVFLMVIPLLFIAIFFLGGQNKAILNVIETEGFLVGCIMFFNLIYLLPGMRRVYGGNWALTTIKAAALSFVVVLLIIYVYKPMMFFIVMHAIA